MCSQAVSTHTPAHCNTRTATHCNTRTATHYNTVQSNCLNKHCPRYCAHHSATHCNTLQRTTTPYNTLQHTATHVLQHTYCNTQQHMCRRTVSAHTGHAPSCQHTLATLLRAARRSVATVSTHTGDAPSCAALQHTVAQFYPLQHTAAHYNSHTATHCNTLQHTATHCNMCADGLFQHTLPPPVCQPPLRAVWGKIQILKSQNSPYKDAIELTFREFIFTRNAQWSKRAVAILRVR